jgi:pimeloyl-ACP methyl ester carboxylesterase
MGGKIAMTLALDRPRLVGRLIVADIAPVSYNHHNLEIINALEAVNLRDIQTRDEVESQLAKNIYNKKIRQFLMQNLLRNGDFFEWRINLNGLKAGMPQLQTFPSIGAEKQFSGPTLFLAGAESDYVQVQHHTQINHLFPNASIVSIENAGHWLHADNPKCFITSVLKFLCM